MCLACTDHDQYECDFLKNSNLQPNFLIDHFDLITPLRCVILKRNEVKHECFNAVMQMESHCKIRMGTPIWKLHDRIVVEPLIAINGLLQKDTEDATFLQNVCGILDVNSFEVRTLQSEVNISICASQSSNIFDIFFRKYQFVVYIQELAYWLMIVLVIHLLL